MTMQIVDGDRFATKFPAAKLRILRLSPPLGYCSERVANHIGNSIGLVGLEHVELTIVTRLSLWRSSMLR